MTPPINIDGDTVEAITIDGSSVGEVTVGGDVVFSTIPDSVVSRGADDTSGSSGRDLGIVFDIVQSAPDFTDFQAEISSNTVVNSTNMVMTIGDTTGTILGQENISGLSAGSVVTFNGINLTAGNRFRISINSTDVNNYTAGFLDNPSYPYTSSDGNLEIVGKWDAGSVALGKDALNIVTIGNINL